MDLQNSDIGAPLSQFNLTHSHKDDVLKLVETINKARKEDVLSDTQLRKTFDKWWPDFEKKFDEILTSHKPTEQVAKRSPDKIAEEILDLCRSVQRSLQEQNRYRSLLTAFPPPAGLSLLTPDPERESAAAEAARAAADVA